MTTPATKQAIRNAVADELAIRHLAWFVRGGWHVVEPGRPLVWNWHLDLICDALEKQAKGNPEYRRLLICVPPGTMKSLLVSVFLPAWQWLREAGRRKVFFSHDEDLVKRDSRRTRDILKSDWYQRVLSRAVEHYDAPRWEFKRDQNEKANYENTQNGFRICLALGAGATGKRGDDILIDDPIDAKAVVKGSNDQITKRLREVATVVGTVLPSRVNDLMAARWTVIMQRLHPLDTAGLCIEEGGWHVIQLQMEYDPDEPLNHPQDPRTEPGELLFPELFPREALDRLLGPRQLGPRHYAAQYQQKPTLPQGGLFKRRCMQHYQGPPDRLTLEGQIISVDCTFKRTTDSDFVTMGCWGWNGANRYLLDQIRARMTYPETRAALKSFAAKHPKARQKIIEDKANGSALIDDLRDHVPGLIPYNPRESKEARAQVAAGWFESLNVWLPEPEYAPWIGAYIEELCAFPGGAHDDQVDQTSQAMIRMESMGDWGVDVAVG